MIVEDHRIKTVRIHAGCEEKLVFHVPHFVSSLRLNGCPAGEHDRVELQLEKGDRYILEIQ